MRHRSLPRVANIDVAPTISTLLGVPPAETVDGRVLPIIDRPSLSVTRLVRGDEGDDGSHSFEFVLALSRPR